MNIKIINQSSNPLPAYETSFSAGLDLRSHLPEGPVLLGSLEEGFDTYWIVYRDTQGI